MSFGDTVSFLALVALVISLAAMGRSLIVRRMDLRRRELELAAAQSAERAAAAAAASEQLEARVRVLERIATNRASSLAHEIDSLRIAAGH